MTSAAGKRPTLKDVSQDKQEAEDHLKWLSNLRGRYKSEYERVINHNHELKTTIEEVGEDNHLLKVRAHDLYQALEEVMTMANKNGYHHQLPETAKHIYTTYKKYRGGQV